MNEIKPFNQTDNSASRSELKYLVSEEVAAHIRKAATLSMNRDPHTDAAGTYPVHSIYLDSPDLAIYRKSVNRETDRFKLRMRFYNDDPAAPVFLEIKQAAGGRGIKKRQAVDREAAHSIFTPGSEAAGRGEFWDVVERFGARPIIHIAYLREAFVGRDDPNTRLTLDRLVRFEPAPAKLDTAMRSPVSIWGGKLILEVKFGGQMPPYIREMVDSLGLETTKASKYIESVSSRIRNGGRPACPGSGRIRPTAARRPEVRARNGSYRRVRSSEGFDSFAQPQAALAAAEAGV